MKCILMNKNTEVLVIEYNKKLGKKERYAWILEDIVPLETPIEAKGKLSIWNYNE